MIITVTHKGWIGLCPVYMTDPESRNTTPHVGARYSWLNWWLSLNDWFMHLVCGPKVPILVTGELAEPQTYNVTVIQD